MSLAAAITLVFFVFQRVEISQALKINVKFDFLELFILSILMYLGCWWVLSFRVSGERFVTVLLFPSMAIFTFNLYVGLIIESVLGSASRVVVQVLASLVIALLSYILILTANILNIGFLEKIPLTQAGRAAHYVMTLISSFLFFSIIFSNTLNVFVKLASVFLVSYLYTLISLWTIGMQYKQRLLSTFAITLTMSVVAFVLMVWSITSEYSALVMVLIYYMLLGIALEIREVLSSRIWLEYTFILVLVVLMLLIVSDWGINGRLI